MSILKVQNISKHFGGITAVNQCSFEVAENSITALIGPNGAGKTTMFDLITGLLKHDSGEIFFRGQAIGNLPTHKRVQMGISRSFQAIRVFPELTALQNIMLALQPNDDGFWDAFKPLKIKQKILKAKATSLLHKINLHEKAHLKAGSLSYGQQKLLEIIRASATSADDAQVPLRRNVAPLSGRPSKRASGEHDAQASKRASGEQLILLDEPAAGVNRTALASIVTLIKELQTQGKTILIVEHDMSFVMELCEEVIVMDYGKEIAHGTPSEIQNNPKVLEAYLGVKK